MHPRAHATPASRRSGGLSILAALAVLLGTVLADGVAFAQTHKLGELPTDEAYIRYLGNKPGSFQADWTTDFNGVTHDDAHWYFALVTPERRPGRPILLENLQGAAFAPSRRILYVCNGHDCDTYLGAQDHAYLEHYAGKLHVDGAGHAITVRGSGTADFGP